MSDDFPLSRRALLTSAALAAIPVASGQASVSPPPGGSNAPPDRDCIIEAAWALVTNNGTTTLMRDASVRVRGDYIVDIAQGRMRGTARRVAAPGHLLLPGFISGHTHVASGTPTRGIIEGGRSYQRPLELLEALGDEELDAITAYNLAELLRSGRHGAGYRPPVSHLASHV